MSEPHLYTGQPGIYGHDRDARNLPLGLVSPGDVRELNEPLDHHWLPLEGNEELQASLVERREAERLEAERLVRGEDLSEEGSGEGESSPDTSPPPLPLPSRRRRPADSDAGTPAVTAPDTTTPVSGSEENAQ